MNTDLALILGLVIAGFSLPAMVSALSDRHAPRAAMLMLLIAGGLILFALTQHPGGYTVAEIPNVFFSVIARFKP